MNGMGFTIKMTTDKYRFIDNSDNSFMDFDTLSDALDFGAYTFLIPEEELDAGMVEMVKNNHSVIHFGGLKGMFLFTE